MNLFENFDEILLNSDRYGYDLASLIVHFISRSIYDECERRKSKTSENNETEVKFLMAQPLMNFSTLT